MRRASHSAGGPPLVLVGGPPGAGKTTLARELADSLQLPLIAKDAIKEAMADLAPVASLAESRRFGAASVGVLYAVGAELLRSGTGVVLESGYWRGVSEPGLRPLLDLARPVQVHCTAPPEVCLRRYVARHERGERHPCHFDGERIALAGVGDGALDWARFGALDLDVPLLRVDTTAGYAPDLEAILAFVRRATLARAARE